MRFTFVALTALVLLTSAALAQDEGAGDAVGKAAESTLRSYVIELTEYRWKEAMGAVISPKELAGSVEQLKKDGKLDAIETVSLSALENHSSMVQFGKNVAVPTGVADSPRGRVRTVQFKQVGTMVQVTARPMDGKIVLGLNYQASRLHDQSEEDLAPDTLTTQFTTTLMIEPGTPTPVGSTTAQPASLVMVSITEQ